ncbi:PIN domain-like protein [Piromyces finnis]|uniref:PIN domain-like protein n=1 Tax=Piromyces finnis TaxID=1754191 RepID=A0A1Y1V994_9FUNG|nr:PIN domain-like protein [Piromyces finnis]|eukprot:ORX50357.1 PIN domain-like protein [Piromyces finnis]
MGVKGLWKLLHPAARPVQLEQLSDKVLAVDASIWLHQFIKALKDKEGKTLNNAHILGFFRRICKFLFHNIKPVFVFDGGVPDLKANTISSRRKRRIKKQESVQRTAKKILAAQIHLNTLNAIQANSTTGNKDENGNTISNASFSQKEINDEIIKAVKLSNYEDRTKKDEYVLPPKPENIMDDYRLASKDELSNLIRYDMDINEVLESKFFQTLPVEVQHKIVYEMKNKSRQGSYERIENMLEAASSALDFSRLQIKGAIYRNKLTEALHQFNREGTLFNGLSKNIASERNNEYILIKNDDNGWSLKLENKDDDENRKKTNLEELLNNTSENFEDTLNKNRLGNEQKYTSSSTYKRTTNSKAVDLLSDNTDSEEDDENIFDKFYKVGDDNENLKAFPNLEDSANSLNPLRNHRSEALLESNFTFPLNRSFIPMNDEKEEEKNNEEKRNNDDKNNKILTTPERQKIFNKKIKEQLPDLTNNFISQSYTDDDNFTTPLDISIDTKDPLMKKSEEDFIEYWVDAATFDFKIEHPDYYNLINETVTEKPIDEILKEWEDLYLNKINKKLNPVKKEDSDSDPDSDSSISTIDEDNDDDNEGHPVEESSEYFYEKFLLYTLKYKYYQLGQTEIAVRNKDIQSIVDANKKRKEAYIKAIGNGEPIVIDDDENIEKSKTNDNINNNINIDDADAHNDNSNNNKKIENSVKHSEMYEFLFPSENKQEDKSEIEIKKENDKIEINKIICFEDDDNSMMDLFDNENKKEITNLNSLISIDDDNDTYINRNNKNEDIINNSISQENINNNNINNINNNNNNENNKSKFPTDFFFCDDDDDDDAETISNNPSNFLSSLNSQLNQKQNMSSKIVWDSVIIDSDEDEENTKSKKNNNNKDEPVSLDFSIPTYKYDKTNEINKKNDTLIKIPDSSGKSNKYSFYDDTFDIIDDDEDIRLSMKSLQNENKEKFSLSQNQQITNYDFKYQLSKLKKYNESNKKENEREENYSNLIARKRKLNNDEIDLKDIKDDDNNQQSHIINKPTTSPTTIIDIEEDSDDTDEVNFLKSPIFKRTRINNNDISNNIDNEIVETTINSIKNEDVNMAIDEFKEKNLEKKENEITSKIIPSTENQSNDETTSFVLLSENKKNVMKEEPLDLKNTSSQNLYTIDKKPIIQVDDKDIKKDNNNNNNNIKKNENDEKLKIDFSLFVNNGVERDEKKYKGKEVLVEEEDNNDNDNNLLIDDDNDFIVESQEYKFKAKGLSEVNPFTSSIDINSDSDDFDEDLKQLQQNQKLIYEPSTSSNIINTFDKDEKPHGYLDSFEIKTENKKSENIEKNDNEAIVINDDDDDDDDDKDSLIDVNTEINDENIEYARMISEISKKDMSAIQNELEEEISNLKIEQLKEQKGSEDITSTMIYECQELLRLFGIPYIVSPMEAEAQCATLYSKKLVNGIVTDDSDIFLFGGSEVYKNMFNQHQYVECYKMSELEKEMNLNREKLINMAYLLGSDYTVGLKGFGIVHAMEIIKEWPGDDGLVEFKQWWEKRILQGEVDVNENKIRKRIYKQCRKVDIPDSFPDPQIKNAYLNPLCDESDQAFQWGTPDLPSLKKFLSQKLRWNDNKINNILVPIIKKMEKNKISNNNDKKQAKLDQFFFNPKSIMESNKLHQSKRIKNVINQWNKKK